MAIEEPSYTVSRSYPEFEIREYAPFIVAETEVKAEFGAAGNEGFRRLAGYIFGGNRGDRKLEMTAPVTQGTKTPDQNPGVKLSMTSPVTQQSSVGGFVIQFVMPSAETMETLPEPLDKRVSLRKVPARTLAVRRYRGGWFRRLYERQLSVLQEALRVAGLEEANAPTWARYNPPFTPWFLRRNEIQAEVR